MKHERINYRKLVELGFDPDEVAEEIFAREQEEDREYSREEIDDIMQGWYDMHQAERALEDAERERWQDKYESFENGAGDPRDRDAAPKRFPTKVYRAKPTYIAYSGKYTMFRRGKFSVPLPRLKPGLRVSFDKAFRQMHNINEVHARLAVKVTYSPSLRRPTTLAPHISIEEDEILRFLRAEVAANRLGGDTIYWSQTSVTAREGFKVPLPKPPRQREHPTQRGKGYSSNNAGDGPDEGRLNAAFVDIQAVARDFRVAISPVRDNVRKLAVLAWLEIWTGNMKMAACETCLRDGSLATYTKGNLRTHCERYLIRNLDQLAPPTEEDYVVARIISEAHIWRSTAPGSWLGVVHRRAPTTANNMHERVPHLRSVLAQPPRVSQISGSNGEWTGSDDVAPRLRRVVQMLLGAVEEKRVRGWTNYSPLYVLYAVLWRCMLTWLHIAHGIYGAFLWVNQWRMWAFQFFVDEYSSVAAGNEDQVSGAICGAAMVLVLAYLLFRYRRAILASIALWTVSILSGIPFFNMLLFFGLTVAGQLAALVVVAVPQLVAFFTVMFVSAFCFPVGLIMIYCIIKYAVVLGMSISRIVLNMRVAAPGDAPDPFELEKTPATIELEQEERLRAAVASDSHSRFTRWFHRSFWLQHPKTCPPPEGLEDESEASCVCSTEGSEEGSACSEPPSLDDAIEAEDESLWQAGHECGTTEALCCRNTRYAKLRSPTMTGKGYSSDVAGDGPAHGGSSDQKRSARTNQYRSGTQHKKKDGSPPKAACRYGSECRRENCRFDHPESGPPSAEAVGPEPDSEHDVAPLSAEEIDKLEQAAADADRVPGVVYTIMPRRYWYDFRALFYLVKGWVERLVDRLMGSDRPRMMVVNGARAVALATKACHDRTHLRSFVPVYTVLGQDRFNVVEHIGYTHCEEVMYSQVVLDYLKGEARSLTNSDRVFHTLTFMTLHFHKRYPEAIVDNTIMVFKNSLERLEYLGRLFPGTAHIQRC